MVDFFDRQQKGKKETFRSIYVFKYIKYRHAIKGTISDSVIQRHGIPKVSGGEATSKGEKLYPNSDSVTWHNHERVYTYFPRSHPLFGGQEVEERFWIWQTSAFTLVNASAVGWFILFTLPRHPAHQSLAGRDSKRPIRNGGARNRLTWFSLLPAWEEIEKNSLSFSLRVWHENSSSNRSNWLSKALSSIALVSLSFYLWLYLSLFPD